MEKVHPHKRNSGMTMTVGELIDALKEYPRNLPVIATWEGVAAGIRQNNITVTQEEGRSELLIDVEDYG